MEATASANPIFAASSCCCYHQQIRRATKLPSQFPTTKSLVSHLGSLPSPWNGVKLLPIPSTSFYGLKEKQRKCGGKVVRASLFGVGAPEALVIGVVALLVFGPKGLAEVARNLGKTLREFQPTIRELQDVSREFKSTLEREMGLDEVTSSTNNTYKPTTDSKETQQATVDPMIEISLKSSNSSLELLDRRLVVEEEYDEEVLHKLEQNQAAKMLQPLLSSSSFSCVFSCISFLSLWCCAAFFLFA